MSPTVKCFFLNPDSDRVLFRSLLTDYLQLRDQEDKCLFILDEVWDFQRYIFKMKKFLTSTAYLCTVTKLKFPNLFTRQN